MRYILAVIFVCAIGMPAAIALPTVGPNLIEVSKSAAIVQVAKRGRSQSHRQSRNTNGIHPLVGSGDY